MMNNTVFKHPLVNYTRGYAFIWCTLSYTITYESNWERAREFVLGTMSEDPEIEATAERAMHRIRRMAGDYSIHVDSTLPHVRTWAADSGVQLTLRFLAHPRRRPTLMDKINMKVMRFVQDAGDVDFAYNTFRAIPTPPAPAENGQAEPRLSAETPVPPVAATSANR
jgi:small-conductance mechanosensitive channel